MVKENLPKKIVRSNIIFSRLFLFLGLFDLVYLQFIESEDEHEDIDDSSDPDQHQS